MTEQSKTATIGLGTMGMSGVYGPSDRAEAIATIRAAIDDGVTLIDTGDFYGMGHNELLIRDALRPGDRDKVRLSVKFGALRGPDNAWGGVDTRPAAIRNFLAYTLVRLGTDHVDVYRPARLDPAVPIEETMGALGELVQEGYVRQIGLSEVGPDVIRRAHAVHPVADLQIEYSLLSRGVEDEVIPVLRELGIGMTAYGVLSRGLLSGHWQAGRALDPGDFRAHSPRFADGNLEHNLALVEVLRAVAERLGATVAQVAIAWVTAQGHRHGVDIVPVVGARTRERLGESLGAAALSLTPEVLAEITAAVPDGAVRGTRYPEAFMAALGSR